MDHCQSPGQTMRSFGRIAAMTAVSILTSAMCAGGFQHWLTGLVIVAILCALPLLGINALLHFFERRNGPWARNAVAALGLSPLLLVILAGGRGDESYMMAIVLAGLIWSAAWLATSHLFYGAPPAAPARPASAPRHGWQSGG